MPARAGIRYSRQQASPRHDGRTAVRMLCACIDPHETFQEQLCRCMGPEHVTAGAFTRCLCGSMQPSKVTSADL